jgi:hypothetical protein
VIEIFRKLLDNPGRTTPGILQESARNSVPSVVRASHLKAHVSGACVPTSGTYTVLGVATYSPLELELFDEIEVSYQRWGDRAEVTVFDLSGCDDIRDVMDHLPSVAVTKQTPLVAIWADGKLVNSQSGFRMTREALERIGVLK